MIFLSNATRLSLVGDVSTGWGHLLVCGFVLIWWDLTEIIRVVIALSLCVVSSICNCIFLVVSNFGEWVIRHCE